MNLTPVSSLLDTWINSQVSDTQALYDSPWADPLSAPSGFTSGTSRSLSPFVSTAYHFLAHKRPRKDSTDENSRPSDPQIYQNRRESTVAKVARNESKPEVPANNTLIQWLKAYEIRQVDRDARVHLKLDHMEAVIASLSSQLEHNDHCVKCDCVTASRGSEMESGPSAQTLIERGVMAGWSPN